MRSLRPAQWAKNSFVLAPLVFARGLSHPQMVARTLLAFAVFCAASSAVYLVNDIRDRERDRQHPIKRLRPLASGQLPVATAMITAVALTLASLAGALLLGPRFTLVVAVYLALNTLYSLWLKEIVILDVMAVSFGYVLRVLAGAAAIAVEVSTWLLLCTTFLALFLTFSKRRHELILMANDASNQRQVLTHYSPAFLDQMINVVTASSVLCYALYAIAPETVEKFDTRNLIYTLPFVLFGVFRYLYLTYQREEERNPTEAILTDTPFLLNLLLWALAVVSILYVF